MSAEEHDEGIDDERPDEEQAATGGEPGPPVEPEGDPDPDANLEADEDPGAEEGASLGLTEEFARIEAEIQDETGIPLIGEPGPPDSPPEPAAEETPAAADPLSGERTEDAAEDLAESEAFPGAEQDEGPEDDLEDEDKPEPELEPEHDGEEEPAPESDDHTTVAPAPTVVQRSSEGTPVIKTTPRPAVPVGVGAGIPEDELEARVPSLWLRFLAGSVLIVASIAAAVSITGLLFLSDVAAKLQPIPGIQDQLDEVDPGEPQTILIIGSDRRAGTAKTDRRSDTTMLLRVDPDKEILSLFSLPRDLKVDIPGIGPRKLNEAYTNGGEKLTLKTVKRFTGIPINHVVEINFTGFADAVNAIDCVYIDVDREYFNVNDGTAANDYAEIDINAGYQRLCGLKALQYVRYRHTDTDLVRAARQQDFLREARQKVKPRELLGAVFGTGTGSELIDIFTEYTRSDIADKNDMIGILKSFNDVRSVPVNEVHFKGDIGGPDDPFVTSTDKQVQDAVDQFLNGVGTEGQRGGEKATENPDKDKKDKKKKDKKKKDKQPEANVVSTDSLADAPLLKFPTLADHFAADAAKNSRRLRIPVFYPTKVIPGSLFSKDSRTYEYRNEEEKMESAYKTVIPFQPAGLVEYYGVMGTTWDDPPILRNPSETRKIGGREYLLFYDGGRLRQVGWKEKGNSYWLSNTLVQSIGEAEMLAIATSMREV